MAPLISLAYVIFLPGVALLGIVVFIVHKVRDMVLAPMRKPDTKQSPAE